MDLDTIFQDAGLIDEAGKATSAPNNGAAPDAIDHESIFADMGLDDKPAAEAEKPAAPAQENTGAFETEVPQYHQVDPDQMRAMAANRINNQMQEAMVYGLSMRNAEGQALYTRADLEAQFAPTRAVMLQQAETEVVKLQLAPYARRAAAEMLSKEHGVKIADIINEPNVESMQAAARILARTSRDTAFQGRKASGVDTAEGARGMSASASEAYEKLSPTQKIAFGLRRGDR